MDFFRHFNWSVNLIPMNEILWKLEILKPDYKLVTDRLESRLNVTKPNEASSKV